MDNDMLKFTQFSFVLGLRRGSKCGIFLLRNIWMAPYIRIPAANMGDLLSYFFAAHSVHIPRHIHGTHICRTTVSDGGRLKASLKQNTVKFR